MIKKKLSHHIHVRSYAAWRKLNFPSRSKYYTTPHATRHPQKLLISIRIDRNGVRSSRLNNNPERGAPKAAAKPEAQAILIISRYSTGLDWYLANIYGKDSPIVAAICTSGSSIPMERHELTASAIAIHLVNPVRIDRKLRIRKPPTIDFNSDRPDITEYVE